MTQAELIIEGARSIIGKRWRHRARGPMAYDCLGLVVHALRYAGVNIIDRMDYSRNPWQDGMRDSLQEQFGRPVSEAIPGDIAVLRWTDRPPCHMGIIGSRGDKLTLIHAHSLYDVTEHDLRGRWSGLYVEAYRP